MVEVTDAALQQAAGEGMDAFIQVFTDAYKRVIGGELTADTMPLLTGDIPRRTHGRWLLPVGAKRIWWLYLCQSVCQSNAFVGSGRFKQIGVCRQKDI